MQYGASVMPAGRLWHVTQDQSWQSYPLYLKACMHLQLDLLYHCLAKRYLQSCGCVRPQIEIGQLDSTIGISEIPFGNLTYWFSGTTLYLSINITQAQLPPSCVLGSWGPPAVLRLPPAAAWACRPALHSWSPSQGL
jgi:hypothetical protein